MDTTFTSFRCDLGFPHEDWAQRFLSKYDVQASANRERRRRRCETDRVRRAAEPATEEGRILDDLMRQRARSRASAVQSRLEHGFRWLGGCVGDNTRYVRPSFVYQPLVSDEHAILKLFVTKLPRAAKLMTGDTKAKIDKALRKVDEANSKSDSPDSKLLALDSPYVVANQSMRGVLRVDLDADLTLLGGGLRHL